MVDNKLNPSNFSYIKTTESIELTAPCTDLFGNKETRKISNIENDMMEVFLIHERCDTLINKTDFSHKQQIDTTHIVDHVLSNMGNNIPEDVRCALNIIIHVSDIIDLVPGKNDVGAFLQDIDKLRVLISRSAQAVLDSTQIKTGDEDVRAYLATLMQGMENALSARHHYLSQKGPHREISDIIGGMLEKVSLFLKQTPTTAVESKHILNNINKEKHKITSFMDKYADFISGGVQYDVHKAICDMDLRIQALDKLYKNNPLSEKEVFEAKINAIESAELVLHKVLKARYDSAQTQSMISAALTFLESRKAVMRERNNPETLSKYKLSELNGGLQKFSGYDSNKLPDEIKSGLNYIINNIYSKVINDENGDESPSDSTIENLNLLEKYDNVLPLSHSKVREEEVMLAFLEKVLALVDMSDANNVTTIDKSGVPFLLKTPKSVLKIYQEVRLNQRDQKGWSEIQKSVQFTHGSLIHNFRSDIIPQAGLKIPSALIHVQDEVENSIDSNSAHIHAFPDLIGEKGQNIGVNSHRSMAYKHVTAFAYSQLKSENGEILFSGTRHGTLLPYGLSNNALLASPHEELEQMIKDLLPQSHWEADKVGNLNALSTALRFKTDKQYCSECVKIMREAATFERAKDVVRSMIAADPKLLQAACNGEQVTVNVNQISLLTPDFLRRSLEFLGLLGANDNEYAMLLEQYNAWDKVSNAGNPIALTLGGDEESQLKITAKVNINTFNFGVNELAFMIPFANRLANERNTLGMRALLGAHADNSQLEIGGQVGHWLNNHADINVKKKQTVITLAQQIAVMWQKGSYKSDGPEPYKMVSRLAVLTHLIGDKADFNCKSGKDRTGELDVEAKYLAAQIAMTGEVPEPDVPRSLEERANFFRMLVEGGNHEFQKYSAGIAGFKLYHLDSLLSAITLDVANNGKGWQSKGESVRWFQGLSKTEGS